MVVSKTRTFDRVADRGYIQLRGNLPKRINFIGYKGKHTHEGIVETSEPIKETMEELSKDYDAVLFNGVRLLPNERERIVVYDCATDEKIIDAQIK
jgi:hypothetical protein